MKLFYFILLLLGCSCQNESSVVHLEIPEELEAHLAMIRLKSFMHDAGYQINQSNRGHVMQIELQSSSKGDEGYVLKRTPEGSRLTANDPAGLHYGVQEIIDQLNQGKALENLQERSEKARFSFRAIKYNLPWDSYRRSPALQLHMDICRDIKYWEKFLNMMLENRFNTLTLWNLHPFNFLVKPASFPKATGFSDLDLKEWQKFWHQLFQMAKQRGIETYLVNWNIFVSPDFAQNYGGAQYSQEGEFFTDGDTSEIVKQYTRECVTQVINQYPDLTGLGITLGEGMGGMTPVEREEWLLETIIEGMRQANRPVKFIHRVPLSANKGSGGSTDVSVEKMTRQTLDSLSVAIEPIYIELKFNWSHGHSTPDLVKVHGGPLSDAYWNPAPSNYKLNWMIRNEDFFCLRWGQPDFIRQHIQQNGHDYVSGYFVGSECYIPARDYFSKEPGSMPWEYAFERQWLFYQTWGRLLYNPGTNDQVFIQQLAQKYPDQPAADLFEAWKQVSQTPLRIASFWNGTWDFTLYSEGFMARQGSGTSLISLENLIDVDPLDPDFVSIREFVEAGQDAQMFSAGQITPLDLANQLENDAKLALKLIKDVDPGTDKGLIQELTDIQIWSNLSLYFASKLKAGLAWHSFLQEKNSADQLLAKNHMAHALKYWQTLSSLASHAYQPMPLVHLNNNQDKVFHWSKLTGQVQSELEMVSNDQIQ